MGGPGSGGARPGSGAKPRQEVALDGPLPEVPLPAEATDAEARWWGRLAPLALRQRTLVPETAARFHLLIRQVVLGEAMEQQIAAEGLSYEAVTVDGAGQERRSVKAHPMLKELRPLMQRIEAGMTAFRLAPLGKPFATVTEAEKPQNALEALQARRLRAV